MPGEWMVQTALLRSTRLNNAHNGKRLGQALFKILKRVGVQILELNFEHAVLDPVQKANHICRYWGEELYEDAMTHAEEMVSLLFVVSTKNTIMRCTVVVHQNLPKRRHQLEGAASFRSSCMNYRMMKMTPLHQLPH